MAAAISAQKDRPRDPKGPSPWEEFLVPTETNASCPVALELIKPSTYDFQLEKVPTFP